jgi:hypothetical protein
MVRNPIKQKNPDLNSQIFLPQSNIEFPAFETIPII